MQGDHISLIVYPTCDEKWPDSLTTLLTIVRNAFHLWENTGSTGNYTGYPDKTVKIDLP